MTAVSFKTSSGAATPLSSEALDLVRGRLRGALCLPGEPGYEQARTIWNAMIDRHPAAIVRAAGAADVIAGVDFARQHGLLLAVRGGGHNIAGNAVCEGGLMIDLTPMKSVRVDPAARTARVEPGVTLGELDRETQAFGLATPVGVNSTTGIAGLTLGGGFGWTSRKYGLAIDNLLAADVVTAAGELLHASEKENPDLFWAIRGGGGNFGIVTSFEFRLHPMGPEVLSGLVVHPIAKAQELLRAYRKLAADAPDELAIWFVLRKAPPLPFLAPEWHGKEIVAFAACYNGNLEAGQKALQPLRSLGKPVADVIAPHPFTAWQTVLDPLLTPGMRNYWKSHSFTAVSDGAIDVLIDSAMKLPSPDCEIAFAQLGGAINRVPAGATAYPHRDLQFALNVHTRWGDRSQDKECVAWARQLFDRMAPHATGGVYVNFMPEDETQRVRAGAYGPNYDRLAKIKAKYDKNNLFRQNQNIQPAA
ncbi:MAG TPA: FAD-binding oxidoreductase [Candidatus Eisenbacteria bacterium]|jgi:FAD/FMN-containing dehydrogenase